MKALKMVVVSALGAAVLASANAAPKTFYAKPDGADDAACTSWDTAGSLNQALTVALGNGGSTWAEATEIIALGGTKESPVVYDLSQSGGGLRLRNGDRFHFHSSTEDPEGTIIIGGGAENPKNFMYSDHAYLVSGFTFTNWVVTASSAKGGAIDFASSGRGAVSNCIFRNCSAPSGGAVYCPRAYFCKFFGNKATSSGGAIFLNSVKTDIQPRSAEISDCVFSNNVCTSESGGAAIYAAASTPVLHCTFGANYGSYCVVAYNIPMNMTNCWFEGNDCLRYHVHSDTYLVSGASGADCHFVSNYSGRCSGVRYGTWSDCTFVGNVGFKDQSGNGPSTCGVSATFRRCVFVDNIGTNAAGTVSASVCYDCAFSNNMTVVTTTGNKQGGGAMNGGKAYDCVFYGNHADGQGGTGYLTTFTRCRIENSSSSSGGAALYAGSATNCLIVGSSGKAAIMSYGHGTLSKCQPCTLVNCTVVGSKNGGVDNSANATHGYQTQLINTIAYGNEGGDIVADLAATNSLWGTVASGKHVYGEGNFPEVAKSPFKERDGNPYSLRRKSDAVDNGLPLDWTADDVDLAGKCRWIGKAVDLGCYEYEPSVGLMLLLR